MNTISEIEDAVVRLSAADLAAFRMWFDALVGSGVGMGVVDRSRLGLTEQEKTRLIADARERSRLLADNAADRAALDDLIDLQAENAGQIER